MVKDKKIDVEIEKAYEADRLAHFQAITARARQLAKHERGWWQGHGERNTKKAMDEMVALYELLFELPHDRAVECVKLRVKAGWVHDEAEAYTRKRQPAEAEKCWKKVEGLLQAHFDILLSARNPWTGEVKPIK